MVHSAAARDVKGDDKCLIGLDVGGTKMACCLVAPDGRLYSSEQIPTQALRGGPAVADDACQLVCRASSSARELGLVPSVLGVSICELVDLHGQIVSEHTVAWRDPQYATRFAELMPIVFEADCRAAALAEARLGAGREFPIFLYITVGTGISCSLVIDGKPYTGASGATGTMATGDLTTFCNRCGGLTVSNLERTASGGGIASRYRQLSERPALSGAEVVTTERVLEFAGKGDEIARNVVHQGATCLGSAVAQLVNVLDPHAVIIGGGLGSAPGYYWDTLLGTAHQQIWSDMHRSLPILQGQLGSLAPAVGAALHAAEVCRDRLN